MARDTWGDATDRVEAVILERYIAGESQKAIAKDYGVSLKRVASAIIIASMRELLRNRMRRRRPKSRK